jgi:hypothetical protein
VKKVVIEIFGNKFEFTATDAETDRLLASSRAEQERNQRVADAADVLTEAGVPRSKLSPLIDATVNFIVKSIAVEAIS